MKLRSPVFEDHESIPAKYTCDGDDINPELIIEDLPQDTKFLVLIMDDPDAPGGDWDHWIMYDIPVEGSSVTIKENSAPGVQGKNGWGKNVYGGPCPPNGEHRYRFKVLALVEKLGLEAGATKRQVEQALKEHLREEARLIGSYKRS